MADTGPTDAEKIQAVRDYRIGCESSKNYMQSARERRACVALLRILLGRMATPAECDSVNE